MTYGTILMEPQFIDIYISQWVPKKLLWHVSVPLIINWNRITSSIKKDPMKSSARGRTMLLLFDDAFMFRDSHEGFSNHDLTTLFIDLSVLQGGNVTRQ